MAKRRFRAGSGEDRAPEELTPEERRARRREELSRSARGKKPRAERTGWRRALVPSAVAAVIVVVILFLWFGVGLLFPHPCLSFGPIPQSSGIPAFPNATTTDFSGTWCPAAAPLYSIHPQLSININGGSVALPPAIGRSTNFSNYECDLPLHTEPGTGGGVFNVTSPWAYDYTLGDFFSVWQSSYVSAHVNATYNTRTIDYTASQLLGLPADASHTLTLFVDGKPSSAGPSLTLTSLNYGAGASPSCLESIYGSGHTIALVYQNVPKTPALAPHGPGLVEWHGSLPLRSALAPVQLPPAAALPGDPAPIPWIIPRWT